MILPFSSHILAAFHLKKGHQHFLSLSLYCSVLWVQQRDFLKSSFCLTLCSSLPCERLSTKWLFQSAFLNTPTSLQSLFVFVDNLLNYPTFSPYTTLCASYSIEHLNTSSLIDPLIGFYSFTVDKVCIHTANVKLRVQAITQLIKAKANHSLQPPFSSHNKTCKLSRLHASNTNPHIVTRVTQPSTKVFCLKVAKIGTSLVAQWIRIRLPIQGTRVRALVREDPTCHGATKPVHHNY